MTAEPVSVSARMPRDGTHLIVEGRGDHRSRKGDRGALCAATGRALIFDT